MTCSVASCLQWLLTLSTPVTVQVMAEVRDEKSGLGTAFSKRGLEAADKHSSSQKHQRMLRHFAQVVSREQEHRKL